MGFGCTVEMVDLIVVLKAIEFCKCILPEPNMMICCKEIQYMFEWLTRATPDIRHGCQNDRLQEFMPQAKVSNSTDFLHHLSLSTLKLQHPTSRSPYLSKSKIMDSSSGVDAANVDLSKLTDRDKQELQAFITNETQVSLSSAA